ncbi:Uncharacterised protein [Streptobacillus moniliformis]|nr:Uncharacterised protein [Streptobacillus moniliformis]
MLGKEKLLYCKLTDGTNLVVTMPGHYNYEIGEVHNFGFDTEALHFFDETEIEYKGCNKIKGDIFIYSFKIKGLFLISIHFQVFSIF